MQCMCFIRVMITLPLLLFFTRSFAQELNIGVTASPIIGMALMDKNSTRSPFLKAQLLNLDVKGGLNLNLRFNNICIETGATAATRSIVFKMDLENLAYNSIGSSNSVSASSTVRATGYSFSAPLLLGYKIYDHSAKTVYHVFGLLGASYEHYTSTGYNYINATASTGSGAGSGFFNISTVYPEPGTTANWINVIAGFKINAILSKVGLVEYGLRYHYPIKNAGQYSVKTIVSNGIYASVFDGDFYPRLSYFDFHFTYYFFNLEKGKRKRYKYN